MAVDHIRYDILAQEALRGVVRSVIEDAAKNGLPGEHHFFISFDTCAEGVRMSPRMKAQYPQEMTVVLQHQFWDLAVSDTGFEVGLSFGGMAERVGVPFAAIKGFFDPSVQFGLQFQEIAEGEANVPAEAPAPAPAGPARPPAEHKRSRTTPGIAAPPAAANAPPEPPARSDDEPDKPSGGGEVVRLDRFRKK
ncbi:MAG: uncharacterized protein QOC56_1161 [Alphaproteobacteria bacterium]|jgi:hypothetical protein|nr:uncharacterized protein [Alphaproteobacteria bacterium]